MDIQPGRGDPGSPPDPAERGTVEYEQLAAALERGLRGRLGEEFVPGPTTARLAHIEARRRLLSAACAILEAEISELREASLETEAEHLERCVQQAGRTRQQLDEQRRRLEAELAGARDPGRFTDLRTTIDGVRAPETIRAAANECLQAIGRIGVAGVRFLWRELENVAAECGHPLTADLVRRFKDLLSQAEIRDQRHAARRRSEESEPTLVLLAEQARGLIGEAPAMSKEELFDHLVSIGGRLKAIDEEAAPVGNQAEEIRRAFGILTRISKEHQPGWTPVLDPKRKGEDWRAMAREADRRIADRRAAQRERQQAAEREQQREALERLRAFENRIVFTESLERLRTAIYRLEGLPDVRGIESTLNEVLTEARRQAEIALRTARSPDDIERLTRTLGKRREEVCSGRVFRPLRRTWSGTSTSADFEDLEAIDDPEVRDAVEDLAQPWPAAIEASRNAGQGERVLLVGGLPSPQKSKLFEKFFGWSAVEWKESYRNHQADYATLRKRIAADRFDRVIVLGRYCGHDVSTSLSRSCRTHGVSYHVHPGGLTIPSLATFIYGA